VFPLDDVRRALARYEPERLERPDVRRAAVAMVLREKDPDASEVLLIERARRPGDRWSGHMAFPGGFVDPGDAGPRAAAERETREEVGLSLADAEYLGRLDDLEGRHAGRRTGLVISAFVFHHPAPGPLTPNEEVAQALWVPMRRLLLPESHVDHPYPEAGDLVYPGILVGRPGRHVVWGLTYRFFEVFFQALGRPFPDRWEGLDLEEAEPTS
jgi:8-oxo-dGTP pyrophosphatase MutT (NUDIX family)